MKNNKRIKVTSAKIENDTRLRCRGLVEGVEVDFIAAVVGQADAKGVVRVPTVEALKALHAELLLEIKKDNKN